MAMVDDVMIWIMVVESSKAPSSMQSVMCSKITISLSSMSPPKTITRAMVDDVLMLININNVSVCGP